MDDEIIFMIGGEDADGDQHAVFTSSIERAIGHYDRMSATLANVRGNAGFEDRVRPLIVERDTGISH